MIKNFRADRTTRIWKETLDNIDKCRERVARETGEILPRTVILDRWAKSDIVKELTINDSKKRRGLL